MVVGVLSALVAGCSSGPSYSPYMEGIPEARADAAALIDDAMGRIVFSDKVIVLGEGRADGCGGNTEGTLFPEMTDYACSMGAMVVFVIPSASTREEVVGAVDAEFEAMDIEYFAPLAADFVMSYPSTRDGMVVAGGGYAGAAEVRVEATPFRPGALMAPRIPRGSADVSVTGNLDAVTASAVEATGASEVLTVLVSTTYWDSAGLSAAEPSSTPPSSASLRLGYFGEGSVYVFDVAHPVPAAAGQACAQDGAVNPQTVAAVQLPFPRLTFELSQDATSDDMQRVRDCLSAALTSGALAVRTPYS